MSKKIIYKLHVVFRPKTKSKTYSVSCTVVCKLKNTRATKNIEFLQCQSNYRISNKSVLGKKQTNRQKTNGNIEKTNQNVMCKLKAFTSWASFSTLKRWGNFLQVVQFAGKKRQDNKKRTAFAVRKGRNTVRCS